MTILKTSMRTDELIALHNQHCPPDAAIKTWKKNRALLIARMLKLSPAEFVFEADASEPPSPTDAPAPSEVTSTDVAAPTSPEASTEAQNEDTAAPKPAAPKAKATKKAAKKPKAPKVKKGKTAKVKSDKKPGAIRVFVEAMLLKTKGTDPKSKRPLGLPYSEILAAVQAKFPDANTTLGCLRWYNTHLNNRHHKGMEKVAMPQRPKSLAA